MSSLLKARLFKGFSANVYGQFVTVGVQVLTVPILLNSWGANLYGEWLILMALPAYLALSDLGLTSVTANKMVMEVGRGKVESALASYQTMFGLLLLVVCLVIIASCVVLGLVFIFSIWGFDYISLGTGVSALGCMILYVLSGLVISAVNSAFRAEGMYSLGMFLSNSIRLFEWGLALVLLILGDGVMFYVAGLLAGRVVGVLVMYVIQIKFVPRLYLGVAFFCKDEIRNLVKPALSFMFFPLGNALFIQGAVVLIGSYATPAMVVAFTAYRTLTRLLVQCATVINQAFWPELSLAYSQENQDLADKLFGKMRVVSLSLVILLSVFLLLFGEFLLEVWLRSEGFEYDFKLLVLLVIAALLNVAWQPYQVLVMSVNKHKRMAAFYLAAAFVFLLASIAIYELVGKYTVPYVLIVSEVFLLVYCTSFVRMQVAGNALSLER